MADPTPGDLLARLQFVADAIKPIKGLQGMDATVLEAIAALSALPAAGGEQSELRALAHDMGAFLNANRASLPSKVIQDSYALHNRLNALAWATTPQPSAAEVFTEKHGVDLRGIKVGEVLTAEQWEAVCAFVREQDAIIDAREDVAVEAQGDGLDVEALRGMFRALVDAGGPSTVARHGVERGADKWENDVGAGMLAIERLLHPERFDEFPAGRSAAPAAGKGVDDAVDAARWRALIGSARVRVLGSAGLHSETDPCGKPHDGYAHIGLELWTKHPAGSEPTAIADLIRYADAARGIPFAERGKQAALTRQPVAEDGDADFELWQDGEFVAGSSGPRAEAWREILHYAAQYEQDGAVTILEVIRRPLAAPAATPTAGGEE